MPQFDRALAKQAFNLDQQQLILPLASCIWCKRCDPYFLLSLHRYTNFKVSNLSTQYIKTFQVF